MNHEELETRIIEYIDGKLSPEDRTKLEGELAANADAFRAYEQFREVMHAMDSSERLDPGSNLKTSFEKMLSEEIAKEKRGKTVFFQPTLYRAAAAVFLVISAVAIGYVVNKNQQREEEMLALKKEVETTKQMMMLMLDNQQSASQRLQGVNVALRIDRADDEVVRALVKAMNEDPNTNVRLAALDALSKFNEEPQVRSALIHALAYQKDPVVQIALIQLLVKMKEKGVVKDLEKIIDNTETIKAVKDEAYSGLLKLS